MTSYIVVTVIFSTLFCRLHCFLHHSSKASLCLALCTLRDCGCNISLPLEPFLTGPPQWKETYPAFYSVEFSSPAEESSVGCYGIPYPDAYLLLLPPRFPTPILPSPPPCFTQEGGLLLLSTSLSCEKIIIRLCSIPLSHKWDVINFFVN